MLAATSSSDLGCRVAVASRALIVIVVVGGGGVHGTAFASFGTSALVIAASSSEGGTISTFGSVTMDDAR